MGLLITKYLYQVSKLVNGQSWSILILGLGSAGKTTLLQVLKTGRSEHTTPTIGHQIETLKKFNLTLNIWDIGGQATIRGLWKNFYLTANALVFMVDSSDRESLVEARDALDIVLASPDLSPTAPLLILANKMDMPDPCPVDQVHEMLGVEEIEKTDRAVTVLPCVAADNEGVEEAMKWLTSKLTSGSAT